MSISRGKSEDEGSLAVGSDKCSEDRNNTVHESANGCLRPCSNSTNTFHTKKKCKIEKRRKARGFAGENRSSHIFKWKKLRD